MISRGFWLRVPGRYILKHNSEVMRTLVADDGSLVPTG